MRALLLSFVLAGFSATTLGAGLQRIPTRDGVTQPFLYEKPAQAQGIVVLFQGGSGLVGITGNASRAWARNDQTFLGGGVARFARNGMVVALVDPPSDRTDMNGSYRQSPEHQADIRQLVAFLRADNPGLPVWLVGTSNGSLSAVNTALGLAEAPPAGVVLTSTVTHEHAVEFGRKFLHPVYRVDLSRVRVPVLVVHHLTDRCEHTPYASIQALMKAFPAAPRVDLITIEGGRDNSRPCDGGYHQFLGQEQEVTDRITDWMRANR